MDREEVKLQRMDEAENLQGRPVHRRKRAFGPFFRRRKIFRLVGFEEIGSSCFDPGDETCYDSQMELALNQAFDHGFSLM